MNKKFKFLCDHLYLNNKTKCKRFLKEFWFKYSNKTNITFSWITF